MQRNYWILSLLLAVAVACAASPALADVVETTTAHFVINSPEAGKAEFEIENPEVGDVQTFWTDTGEQVIVSYDEEGFLIEIGDEEIRVAAGGAGSMVLPDGANGFVFEDTDENVFVMDGEGGDGHAVVWHMDDGDGDGDGGTKREVHVIRRGDATVELLEDGETKVIEIPGGDDIQVLRTKGEDGTVQVKILRDGEEIDPSELKDGHGMHVIHMGEGDGDGPHVVKVRQVKEGDGDGQQVKVKVEKVVEGDPDNSSGTQVQVQIKKTVEDQ